MSRGKYCEMLPKECDGSCCKLKQKKKNERKGQLGRHDERLVRRPRN